MHNNITIHRTVTNILYKFDTPKLPHSSHLSRARLSTLSLNSMVSTLLLNFLRLLDSLPLVGIISEQNRQWLVMSNTGVVDLSVRGETSSSGDPKIWNNCNPAAILDAILNFSKCSRGFLGTFSMLLGTMCGTFPEIFRLLLICLR